MNFLKKVLGGKDEKPIVFSDPRDEYAEWCYQRGETPTDYGHLSFMNAKRAGERHTANIAAYYRDFPHEIAALSPELRKRYGLEGA